MEHTVPEPELAEGVGGGELLLRGVLIEVELRRCYRAWIRMPVGPSSWSGGADR